MRGGGPRGWGGGGQTFLSKSSESLTLIIKAAKYAFEIYNMFDIYIYIYIYILCIVYIVTYSKLLTFVAVCTRLECYQKAGPDRQSAEGDEGTRVNNQ